MDNFVSIAIPAGLALALIISAGALWIKLLGPLDALVKAAACFKKGDFACSLTTERHADAGEMGRLQELFSDVISIFKEKISFGQGVLNGICVPVMIFSRDNRLVFANQLIMDLYEKSGKPEDSYGKISGEFIFGDPNRATISQRALEEKRKIEADVEYVTAKGTRRNCHVASTPYFNMDGEIMGTLAIWIDQTELVLREKQANERNAQLATAAQEVERVSQQLSSAAEQLSSAVDHAANGATGQRDRMSETATAMEEMNATVLEVARNAGLAAEAGDAARTKARGGAEAVSTMVKVMDEVGGQAEALNGHMRGLQAQAERIGTITAVITEIADQTNLLALNAAIEAARAGDAGRGFAVVADEVRKLAEKTMTATKEVGEAIDGIRRATALSLDSVSATVGSISTAGEMARSSGEALSEIQRLTDASADQIRSIATASEQQSAASEEINRALEEVAGVASETAEDMNHSQSAVRELSILAEDLLKVTQGFQVGRDASLLAQSEHKMKGVLPKLLQEYVREACGQAAYERMQKAMGNPVFLPTHSYPDAVIMQMASLAAEGCNKKPRDILHGFGFFTPARFNKYYKKYFRTKDLREFLLSLNAIHAEVAKDMPGVEPPRFEISQDGSELVIEYRSKRGLFDYFEGVIKGTSDFFGQKADVSVTPMDKERAKASIRLRS